VAVRHDVPLHVAIHELAVRMAAGAPFERVLDGGERAVVVHADAADRARQRGEVEPHDTRPSPREKTPERYEREVRGVEGQNHDFEDAIAHAPRTLGQ